MIIYRNNIASLPQPTLSAATSSSMKVAGEIGWYKDGESGYAYKLTSASNWTYKSQSSKSVSATISNLAAETSYDVCLYVKFNGEYQRGEKATLSTTA